MSDLLPFVVLGLVSGSVYGLASLGLVLTYRTSGVLNFAHGSVAAVGAYAFYQLRQENGLPWPVALAIVVLVVGPVVGVLLERMARAMTNASVTARVVATVGILVAVQQLAAIRYGSSTREFRPFLPTDTFGVAGVRVGVDQAIVVGIALGSTVLLTLLLRRTRLGLSMRGVVDNDSLLGLTGASPAAVRRWSWCIGSSFAALSGVLIAPTIGLDAPILTLLVVQAFGAAAFGLFTSLPLAYAGGLLLGVLSALSSKYVTSHPSLSGLPSSLPFLFLFGVLLVVPRRRLVDIAPERRAVLRVRRSLPVAARLGLSGLGIGFLTLVPLLVGTRTTGWTVGLAYTVVFLSLVLLERLSGQLSLAQLAFAAVGAAAFAHFAHGAGLPWVVAVLLGALTAVPVGALLAIPAIRLSGLYLALATFGFGLLMQSLVYRQGFMFGNLTIETPRPTWAQGDRAYYYVVLVGALLAAGLFLLVRRSPLGRLLRAMADSPLALATGGMSVTAIKVVAFCISAFLAGLGGALLGPVTGSLSTSTFETFASLTLVVVLALMRPFGDVPAAFAAAVAFAVLPNYLGTHPTMLLYLPLLFGASAIAVAMSSTPGSEGGAPAASGRARGSRSRSGPVQARLRSSLEGAA